MNHLKTYILLAGLTALFAGAGYLIGGPTGMAIALALAVAMNAFSYWNADKIVLRTYGAVEVDESHPEPLIRNYVTDVVEMAARAGLPRPRVTIIDSAQPNAFATGRDPAHAAVAATTGLLSLLTRDEIRGVMAHELAHVKNRDTLTMTVTATLAGAISMLSNFAFLFGGNRDDRNNPLGFVGVLIAMIVAPLAAMLVQMAISRTREYAADRRGAEICGSPRSLASALEKIAGDASHIENYDAERNPATAHMFIINPLSGQRMDNLFSTHPNTENRIAALLDMPETGVGGSTRPERTANPPRKSRSVPNTGWGRGGSEPPKGPWS